jgi:predicted MPP superfamily phosphohydrolase
MFETFTTAMILLLCWLTLAVADLVVSGVVSLCAGVAFRKVFLWGLVSLVIPPLAVAYGALWERNWFKVNEVELRFESLPEGFDGYRIVHVSDIHARSFVGREKHLERAADIINSLDADLVAFTGDLISMAPDELESTAPILRRISAKDGVVSVLGNHDYSPYTDVDEEIRKRYVEELVRTEKGMGWNLLIDSHEKICRGEDSIAVIGVQNISPSRHFHSQGDLSKASEGTEGMFSILLSHDPMHWEAEVQGKDIPLTLSGHTHAMQMSLLGWSPSSLIFRQNKGLYSSNGKHLYVNVGLGETIFPARIGARPEITLITLTKQSNKL